MRPPQRIIDLLLDSCVPLLKISAQHLKLRGSHDEALATTTQAIGVLAAGIIHFPFNLANELLMINSSTDNHDLR